MASLIKILLVYLQTTDDAAKKTYEFWSTQPVPKIDEHIITGNEAIEANKPHDDLRQEPYSLPQDFHWDTLNLDDPLVVSKYSARLSTPPPSPIPVGKNEGGLMLHVYLSSNKYFIF